MLAKPLYEKPKPAAKPKMPGRMPKERSLLPHILMGACLLLLVLIIGAAVLVSGSGANSTPEENTAKQEEPAPGNVGAAQGSSSSQGAPKAAGTAASKAAKAPSTTAPASSELKLDAFRYPVVSEADAAERMNQIISYFEKGSPDEKRAAYKALVDMGAFAAKPLPGAIDRSNEKTLTWLAMASAQLKATSADRMLIERVEKASGKVDNNVILSIGKLATPAARDFCLASMKQESNKKLREVAWESFTYCAASDDISFLLSALEKGERYQQERAAQALGRLGRNSLLLPQIVNSLEKALSQGEASPNRMAHARAIASLPSSDVQSLLTGLLFDRNADIRMQAIRGLGSATSTMGIMLSSLQNETDPRVLRTAADCLAELPYESATPKLLEWMNSSNGDLSAAAYRALVAAYGLDCGYRSGPWEAWIKLGTQDGDPGRSKLFLERQKKAQAEKQVQSGLLAFSR